MSYNVPVRTLQDGTTLEIATGGTLNINGGALLLGGTAGRWSFGTASISGGVGTIATGLGTVIGATATVAQDAVGTFSSVVINYSLATSGSIVCYAVGGTVAVAGGRIAFTAFGY